MTNKKKIKIEIKREDGKTYLSFEIDKSFSEIFEEKSEDIRESENWKGLKFYFVPEITDSTAYQDLLSQYGLRDDFGTPLFKDGRFNIAFIRTVGGKGEILVKNSIPFSVVSEGMRNVVSFLKNYYENFLRDYKVKGFLTFEV